ncbi:tannase/feruloyl esterase family alpha/beta hydrolase [Geodermatophilus sabuli]|uniref:Tannase/feruloyl esterase family alpha/beta hydrolase n=1 Tax=Geodermatophilus sabuli TaxID=1564158 RepID=A0A7K3W5S0_9ACTN|nr:tannase/feruloyl esterase family alpha/beta hydrolase [Geodermatophilus sabuli]NEK60058.1 tannase/feruloyl esterase family alpha/beta hydrolase [Geodermatophilus sabuli]
MTTEARTAGTSRTAVRPRRRWGTAALALATGAVTAATLAPTAAAATTPTGCADLVGTEVPADAIGLPTSGAVVDSATVVPAAAPLPEYCDVRFTIRRVDPDAPDVSARVNLPTDWNGRGMHFGGGGYNGVVPEATGNAPSAPPDTPPPLARGYATFASDSGHTGGNATFALNEEALVNFGYAALKKTRDVAGALIRARYGTDPHHTYFVGSSQGGREGLTVAQRFPDDYDGVLSRVPVVPFTALQLAGNRVGAAVAAGGWMNAAEIQTLTDATFAACDPRDGVQDGLIARYPDCDPDPAQLLCPPDVDPATSDTCLSAAQVDLVRTVRSDLELDVHLANGVRSYPGWPAGHEALSWPFWITGAAPLPETQAPGAVQPGGAPFPGTSAVANFGAQWVRYAIAQDPDLDTRTFDPDDPRWRERIREVSEIVDSTDPDLSAFRARGGKLIMQEHFGDYAQSGFAGARYFESVVDELGRRRTADFARLYVSPGADHGGQGAPSLVDWVSLLETWVEDGEAPRRVVQSGTVGTVARTLPACQYPEWPRYRGGPVEEAASYRCTGSHGHHR